MSPRMTAANPKDTEPRSNVKLRHSRLQVGLAAAFGGAAPALIRLAIRLAADEHAKLELSAGYVVGLFLFAVLGYVVAMIWNERIPRRALYLGLGLPALLQVGGNAFKAPATAFLDQPPGIFSAFSTSAYAQAPAKLVPPPTIMSLSNGVGNTRKLNVSFSDLPSDTRVVFVNAAGKTLGVAPDWKAATTGRVNIAIPHDATQVRLLSASARNTPTFSLQPTGDQSIQVATKTDFTAGFLKAMGVNAADTFEIRAGQRK